MYISVPKSKLYFLKECYNSKRKKIFWYFISIMMRFSPLRLKNFLNHLYFTIFFLIYKTKVVLLGWCVLIQETRATMYYRVVAATKKDLYNIATNTISIFYNTSIWCMNVRFVTNFVKPFCDVVSNSRMIFSIHFGPKGTPKLKSEYTAVFFEFKVKVRICIDLMQTMDVS